LGLAGAGSCGKKALNQIDAAKMAVDQARAADAPVHAPGEFTSAEEYLSKAEDEYDKYKFSKSEEAALQAEDYAKLALDKALAESDRLRKEKEDKVKAKEEEARLARELAEKNRDSLDTMDLSPEEKARSVMKDVFFDYDSAEISGAAESTLLDVANFLLQHPNIRVKIEGHCDDRGSSEYNLALGSKRAKAVLDFLVARGIGADRMETISYGEDIPLDPAQTEGAWGKNRRAHFAVIN